MRLRGYAAPIGSSAPAVPRPFLRSLPLLPNRPPLWAASTITSGPCSTNTKLQTTTVARAGLSERSAAAASQRRLFRSAGSFFFFPPPSPLPAFLVILTGPAPCEVGFTVPAG